MDADSRLLEIVGQLAKEMHSSRIPSLDLSLERDLGFDSLARVELSLRIERAFGVQLPEEALAGAETPRDLLNALGRHRPMPPKRAALAEPEPDSAGSPSHAKTLVEALDWHVAAHPARLHILFEDREDVRISYAELKSGAQSAANGLVGRGVKRGESVAIMLPTGREYFYSFFGIIMAGGIPVPIYPPFRRSQMEDHLRRHAGILSNAGAVMMITFSEALEIAKLLKFESRSVKEIVTPAELFSSEKQSLPVTDAEDIALLQYTSGSTGNPKGVALTHANLLANIRAMGQAAQVDSSDVFVSWLPLYHDMGLIGAWLGSLYHACRYVVMSPTSFLARPSRWLSSMSRNRGTLTASPNFGYALCLSKIEERELEGLDLSSLRMAFNGAEPVSAEVIRGFTKKFEKRGFRKTAMTPVYGLAESSVGLAFTPAGRGPKIDEVDRAIFTKTGRAEPAAGGGIFFVSCGLPLPGHEIRVVDGAGREVGERTVGRLEFKGPSSTRGYFRNPGETARLLRDGWLDSGDYAYIAEGEIYPAGRVKDLVIRAGRNLYPYEAEEAVGNLPGVRRGCVAIFGVPGEGTERLVVMAETKQKEAREKLHDAINRAVVDALGEAPDEIVLVPAHTVLKTSSGKIRRAANRAWYLGGMKKSRYGFRSALAWIRARHVIGDFLYAGYLWLLFWTIAPLAWIFTAASMNPARNWRAGRLFAGLFMKLSGLPFSVSGIENMTHEPAIIVANHASYVDGIVLVAALPGNMFTFVAKNELQDSFISGTYLEHLGAEFVERAGLGEDSKRLEELAKRKRSMIFFPEGTFTRIPGLARFRMGAFLAASRSGLPVVPVAIRGARTVLRDGSWFPRKGRIEVVIGEPIRPEGREWRSAVKLRDAARMWVLARCGEPDLQ